MGVRCCTAPFLSKAYEIVDDSVTDQVISWNDQGDTFVVWKMAEFTKDLLPTYFKHSNFSSFVRQLNTYGFRKTVPDKWEFANDHFKRGHKHLLTQIRRRKSLPPSRPPALKPTSIHSSPSNSGLEFGSTSTPDSHLSGENQRLKRDNDLLTSELARTKRHCEELVSFLKERVNVGPDQIDRIIEASAEESSGDLRLFGVWLKGGNKRMHEENIGCGGPRQKEMKISSPTRVCS